MARVLVDDANNSDPRFVVSLKQCPGFVRVLINGVEAVEIIGDEGSEKPRMCINSSATRVIKQITNYSALTQEK